MDDTRLTALLAKKRPPIKAGLVDAVMAQTVSDADKADRIEMIDLLPDGPPRAAPAPAPKPQETPARRERPRPPRPKTEPPLVNPELNEAERVEHRRRHLGKPPGVSGFWRYLFRERRRMLEWGGRTSTLVRGVFPWVVKLSPEALQFASALGSEILPVLEQNLPRFLAKAWKMLEKYEYNLLAALRPLCQVLAAMTPGPQGPIPARWDPVLPAVTLFWAGRGAVRQTIDSWNLACVKLGASDAVRLGGQDSLRTLLEARGDRVCLPDFLRALLMLRTRRAVEWPELTPLEDGDYFARETFECAPEVQAEINRAVAALKGQLEPVDRDFAEVRRIRYFLPHGRLLEEFDGGMDRADRAAWCLRFLERAEPFTALLSGTVTLQGGARTVLFRDIAISSALTRLGVLHTQLSATEHDPDLPSAVARVVTNLGKLLVIQIRDRSLAADPLVRQARPGDVADPLPQELDVLERPAEWTGMRVIDALVKTARLCLLAGRFLGDTSLETALEKEEPLKERAQEILQQLKRLAAPAELTELLAAWSSYLTPPEPDDAGAPTV